MIEYRKGNLLEADAEALVNTVNCVGVMGKGIALQFKKAYPDNFREYEKACKKNLVKPGSMFIHSTGSLMNPRYIINFPTKRHWKGKSQIGDIEDGLVDLIEQVKKFGINSVAVPPLGCGNGGLEWNIVRSFIEKSAESLPDVKFLVYEPSGSPSPEKMKISEVKPALTRARALFIALINNYNEMGYKLSKLEIQKLAYFLQEAGEPLRLRFVRHHYGPYANNLNHVLKNLEGHYISGFGDGTSGPEEMSIHLLPKAMEDALFFMGDDPDALDRLKRVSEIIYSFETPYGMELLATVHWVLKENPLFASKPEEVVKAVKSWSKRKENIFMDDHILTALDHLVEVGMPVV